MKKILFFLLFTLLFWVNKFTFADFNENQKQIYDKVISVINPIIQKKGDNFRIQVVNTLVKNKDKIKNIEKKEIIIELINYYDTYLIKSSKTNIVEENSNINNFSSCPWHFYTDDYEVHITSNKYLKKCDDLDDKTKTTKYILSTNDKDLINRYFYQFFDQGYYVNDEYIANNIDKNYIFNFFKSIYISNDNYLDFEDLKKIYEFYGIDKNYFQSIREKDYNSSNPIIQLIYFSNKSNSDRIEKLIEFLISNDIYVDNSSKEEIGKIIYEKNHKDETQVNRDNISNKLISILTPLSIRYKDSLERSQEEKQKEYEEKQKNKIEYEKGLILSFDGLDDKSKNELFLNYVNEGNDYVVGELIKKGMNINNLDLNNVNDGSGIKLLVEKYNFDLNNSDFWKTRLLSPTLRELIKEKNINISYLGKNGLPEYCNSLSNETNGYYLNIDEINKLLDFFKDRNLKICGSVTSEILINKLYTTSGIDVNKLLSITDDTFNVNGVFLTLAYNYNIVNTGKLYKEFGIKNNSDKLLTTLKREKYFYAISNGINGILNSKFFQYLDYNFNNGEYKSYYSLIEDNLNNQEEFIEANSQNSNYSDIISEYSLGISQAKEGELNKILINETKNLRNTLINIFNKF